MRFDHLYALCFTLVIMQNFVIDLNHGYVLSMVNHIRLGLVLHIRVVYCNEMYFYLCIMNIVFFIHVT